MDANDSAMPGASLEQGYDTTEHRPGRWSDDPWYAGEREAADVLTSKLGDSASFLFNRRVGSGQIRGDISIIAVAASGVFVLDPKDYWGRKVRANRTRDAFVVNGRVRPALADSMRRHVDAVRVAMVSSPMPTAPVSSAWCFMGADLPVGRLVVDGVPATTLRGAVRLLKRSGPIGAKQRAALHAYLSEQFPPA